jgi:general secretion pathway protein J
LSARRTRGAAGGFTLLELLIAMLIGSVLVYMSTEVLSLVQRGVEQSRELAGQMMAEQRAIAVVKAAISNLVPPASDTDERHRIVATGSAFEFAAIPADSQVHAGTVRASVLIEPASAGGFVVAFEQRGQGPTSSMPNPPRLVLLQDLSSASLQYLYRTPLGLRTHATRPAQAPELVTLHWTKAGNGGKSGSLSVRPRLDVGANCRLDFLPLSCR